jgi:hypothetical protein
MDLITSKSRHHQLLADAATGVNARASAMRSLFELKLLMN